ncbi:MAG: HutD-family protein [Nocardioides sp.]|nr:HutD-family protein [Nocardioides sp.]
MAPLIVRAAELVNEPWPNGGGWTRQIYSEPSPHSPAQCSWRLSLATIDATGPFSFLPGVQRQLLVVSDNVLDLSIDGDIHTLGQGESVAFDGGASVECGYVSGVCTVLNLMTYRGIEGRLHVTTSPLSNALALTVLDGQVDVLGERLQCLDTLIPGPATLSLRHRTARFACVVVTNRT